MRIKSAKVQRKCVLKVEWLKIDGCMHPLLKIEGCSCTLYYEDPDVTCITVIATYSMCAETNFKGDGTGGTKKNV